MQEKILSQNDSLQIRAALGEILLLTLMVLLPFLSVYIDVTVIGQDVGELSLTELSQSALLLLSVLIFGYSAWEQAENRGCLLLMSGFLACALLREQDAFLDEIWQGFWLYPALLLSFLVVFYAVFRCRSSIIAPIYRFVGTKSYYFLLMGLLVVLVFSRLFGSGGLLWKDILGAAYTARFKGALQEGLELFGYFFIAFGALCFRKKDDKLRD